MLLLYYNNYYHNNYYYQMKIIIIIQIPVSKCLDIDEGDFTDKDKNFKLLYSIYTLQCPDSSPWKKPFIRVASNHHYDPLKQTLNIKFYIYFTRLIFELISDPSIKHIIDNISGCLATRVSVQKLTNNPVMFNSSLEERFKLPSYRFSL